MIEFRPLQEKDISSICSFPRNEKETYFFSPLASYPLSIEAIHKIIAERLNPTVVTKNSQVVGFSDLYNVERSIKSFIGNVIVSPSSRGEGIGKLLIENMTKISIELYKIREIHISCFNNNLKGLLLYSKLGFKPYSIEERINYNNERIALIHMKKEAI